jgi:hypothetical protein
MSRERKDGGTGTGGSGFVGGAPGGGGGGCEGTGGGGSIMVFDMDIWGRDGDNRLGERARSPRLPRSSKGGVRRLEKDDEPAMLVRR